MSINDRSQQYFEEAREQLDLIEQNLLLLEQAEDGDLSLVNEIFRAVHTIKGGADFLGLRKIKELAHAAEDALDLVRQKKLNLTPEGNSTLLVVTDSLKEMLQNPEQSQSVDITHLLQDINAMSDAASGVIVDGDHGKEADLLEVGTPSSPGLFSLSQRQCRSFRQDGFNLYILELIDSEDPQQARQLETILSNLVSIGYILDSKTTSQHAAEAETDSSDGGSLIHILFRSVLTRTTTIRYLNLDARSLHELKSLGTEALSTLPVPGKNLESLQLDSQSVDRRVERRADRRRSDRRDENGRDDRRGAGNYRESGLGEGVDKSELTPSVDSMKFGDDWHPADADEMELHSLAGDIREEKRIQGSQSIRVSVGILDGLMNLVGELVLTRNQLKQNIESKDQSGISITAQRLEIVTTELQESIMSTRMQPLGNILTKFHRIIRDMSNQLGKSVNLVLEGEDVELDKSIIENISDPLTHLVRNAIDHGIETPDVRHSKGKPVNATLAITARQEAGHVVIEISDDGRGINIEKIKEHAIKRGNLDKSKSEEITEKELLKYIFTPGFSTAEVVSDISGRGVGLDVVFTNISKLGGNIDIDTKVDVGTTFRVSLPLTLAIVPSLLVSSGDETFAIPQINLAELVRIPPDQKDRRIEYLGDTAVMRLRDKLLPIVWLDKILGLNESSSNSDESVNIAVVTAGEYCYGIAVDTFTDSEEIVVKPLGVHLRNTSAYSSATILGDGSAALILDVNGIAELVNMSNQHARATEAQARHDIMQKAQEKIGNERSLLIVENNESEYYGIELAYVNRIERVRESLIESMANKHVIKYRGGVLRIFNLDDAVKCETRNDNDGHVYLIVFYLLGTEVAVLVSDIVDIVDTYATVDSTTFNGAGIIGSTIIMDRITLLVDLFELVKFIDPEVITDQKNTKKINSHDKTNRIALEDKSRKTVLVVEDSVFFQDKLNTLLEDMNINVLMAEDGQDGWDMLNDNAGNIDLILMDVEMPNMNGLELSRLIRSDEKFYGLPIIMLTSLAKQVDVEEGIKAGASEYLIKMDQEMVRRTVNRYLNIAAHSDAGKLTANRPVGESGHVRD